MTLVRFKPSQKDFFVDSMIPSNMMNLIDNMFNDSIARFDRHTFFSPKVDVIETAGQYELSLAIPGIERENVSIELEKNMLKISGEKHQRKLQEGEKFHQVENQYGKFSRTFNLPENVNKDAVEASFNNGVLTVLIPKMESKETKSIIKIK
jgi:HSP20 family protein